MLWCRLALWPSCIIIRMCKIFTKEIAWHISCSLFIALHAYSSIIVTTKCCLCYADDFDKARQKAKMAEDTSDLDTASSDTEKKVSRQKRARNWLSDDDVEPDSPPKSAPRVGPKKSLILPAPPVPQFLTGSSDSTAVRTPTTDTASSVADTPYSRVASTSQPLQTPPAPRHSTSNKGILCSVYKLLHLCLDDFYLAEFIG